MPSVCMCILVWTLVFVTFLLPSNGQVDSSSRVNRRRNRNRNRNENGNPGLPSDVDQMYQTAVENDVSTLDNTRAAQSPRSMNHAWRNFVPTTPLPEEVDCQVEVYLIETIGGRCTRLGGIHGPYICQSGIQFDFHPPCREVIENRQLGNGD